MIRNQKWNFVMLWATIVAAWIWMILGHVTWLMLFLGIAGPVITIWLMKTAGFRSKHDIGG